MSKPRWSPLPGDVPPPRHIGPNLDAVLRRLGGGSVDATRAITARWAEVVGPEMAAHTRPARLRGGVLQVLVDDPALASDLRWRHDEVRTAVVALVGEGTVRGIEFTVRAPRRDAPPR